MAGQRGLKTAAQKAIEAFERAQEEAPELSQRATRLFTLTGWLNAVADLQERFSSGGDRDDISAMNGEFKCLKEIGGFIAKMIEHQTDERLSQAGEELTRQMSRKGMASGTSFDGFDPPTKPAQGGH